MTARAKCAGSRLRVVMPCITPEPRGRLGVRSPLRYGRKSSPRRAGRDASHRAASMAAWSQLNMARACSVATVTFMVQTSGSQPSVLSQNAATSPSSSTTGSAL